MRDRGEDGGKAVEACGERERVVPDTEADGEHDCAL